MLVSMKRILQKLHLFVLTVNCYIVFDEKNLYWWSING